MTVTDRNAATFRDEAAEEPTPVTPPLYWRLLRLQHLRPNGWQRALLVEGVLAVAVVLVLADVATAWTLLALPLAATALVKGHDVLAGFLARPAEQGQEMSSSPARPQGETRAPARKRPRT
jgi:hypothetical protein